MNARHLTRHITTPALALLAVLGCSNGSAHTPALDESVAARLTGTWDLTFTLERPLSLSTDARTLPRSVSGTAALLEVGSDPMSFDQMRGATHMGVFRVDLAAMGFPGRESGVIPDVAARVVATPQSTSTAAARDSVYLILDPETPRYSIRLAGTFDANSASGVWIAESFLGGGGSFVMRRR
jgi:hypothetical protein